ncbi:protein tyrosine phosphatase family protein [Octadecabacter sp. G9-8]|uniref:Protein tyrosine phosphatase family protein n=1 Tax=Octadecabacter dasysiphoniae TaxID=2909341 RepID=A0ABS9CZ37_9RHOB|nr:protein tyrosine phosphatase family protein [Octadecabacter dasysiphoniae]MCF2872540.1 protein tyrosine phosphatase family protein [Octadecabacter dasysiphoniae]
MTDLPQIINWRRLDGNITTSGQPTEDQLGDIKSLGVTHIINLGPHHNKGALNDEAASVAALGMEYVYIPVMFQTPTDADFDAFCAALDRLSDTKIHVHCIYNARVTAFFYRYAKEGRGMPVADAFAIMDGIWRPGQDWAAFIGEDSALGQLNRYAGDDYVAENSS